MPIRLVPIIPTRIIHPAWIEGRITSTKQVIREESGRHERMFDRFTRTWSVENKPRWDREEVDTRDEFSVTLKTESTPFVFVEKGTSIRYRVMSRDFQPKTRPRIIGSRGGAGRAAGFGVKPGIEARNIRTEIAKRRAGPLQKKLTAALRIQNVGFARLSGTPAALSPADVRSGFGG